METRAGAKGKWIEAAQKEKPNLTHLDYNLGRAESSQGNDVDPGAHFEGTEEN